MNDPLRVAREGPFWASMFVVLGAVVGFGGSIEVRISLCSSAFKKAEILQTGCRLSNNE